MGEIERIEYLRRFLKKKVRVTIKTFAEVEVEGGTKVLKEVFSDTTLWKRADIIEDIVEANKLDDIEYCAGVGPKEVIFGKVYIRKDGAAIYIYGKKIEI